jgi:hypothetical protein
MSGEIVLLDTNSIVLNLPIIGQEYLSFKIKTASLGNEGTDIIDYTENVFSIYKIDKRLMGDGAEAIVLHFASPEMLRNNRTRVSKSYTNSIDKIVIDVLQNANYLNSKKDLFIEGTVGVRKLIAPNSFPFTFVQKLASEAISTAHGSPYFMFYENKDGIHFRSLDSLYNQPVSAEYNTGKFSHQERSGTVVRDVLDEYSRPISHQIVQSNDMLSNVRGGLLGSNLITHDIYKKNYNTKSFRYFKNFPDYSRLSNNPIYNTNVIDEFGFVSRLDTIQAVVLDYRLKKVNGLIKKRRKNASLYKKYLTKKNTPFVATGACTTVGGKQPQRHGVLLGTVRWESSPKNQWKNVDLEKKYFFFYFSSSELQIKRCFDPTDHSTPTYTQPQLQPCQRWRSPNKVARQRVVQRHFGMSSSPKNHWKKVDLEKIIFFNDKMLLPSFYSLVPIIGTMLVIWFSHKDIQFLKNIE